MKSPQVAGKYAVGLVGEALSRVGKKADVLVLGQLPVPARAEHRVVEEDTAADVREDQTLAPARRVLARLLGLGPEPLLEKAELALRSVSVVAVAATTTPSVSEGALRSERRTSASAARAAAAR